MVNKYNDPLIDDSTRNAPTTVTIFYCDTIMKIELILYMSKVTKGAKASPIP